MKKMIFTAMAVLAFSAVSVANTIEVKEEVVVKDVAKIEILVVEASGDNERDATPCENMALDFYELLISLQGGGDDIGLLNDLIAACH